MKCIMRRIMLSRMLDRTVAVERRVHFAEARLNCKISALHRVALVMHLHLQVEQWGLVVHVIWCIIVIGVLRRVD